MLKNMKKSTKSNVITLGIVVGFYVLIQILSAAGALTNSFSGQLVPICAYVIMAVSLNLTVGMNPNETEELMHTIHSVRDQFGVAILLIEHDMNFVMGICEEITVLDYGRVIARGDGKAIRNNPKVIAAYLGGD